MKKLIFIIIALTLFSCGKDKRFELQEQKKEIENQIKYSEQRIQREKDSLEVVSKQKAEDLKKAEEDYKKAVEDNNKSGKTPGKYPYASTREMPPQDYEPLSDWERKVMYNEIYARHGLIFKDAKLRDYFSAQKWYKPKYENVDKMLNEIEQFNMESIRYYEFRLEHKNDKPEPNFK